MGRYGITPPRTLAAAIAVIVILCVCPAAYSAQNGTTMYVNPPSGYNLNLRSAPSFEAQVIASYRAGQEVTALDDLGDWHKVSVNFCIGYMASVYLSSSKPGESGGETQSGGGSGGDSASRGSGRGGSGSRGGNSGSSGSGNSGGGVGSGSVVYVRNPKSSQRLNLRSQPSLSGEIIGSYPNGTRLAVSERRGEWLKVSVGGESGFVMAKYTTTNTPNNPPSGGSVYVSSTDHFTVTNPNGGNFVNQRSGVGFGYGILQQVSVGTSLRVEARRDEWVRVTVNGTTGWMHSAFLK